VLFRVLVNHTLRGRTRALRSLRGFTLASGEGNGERAREEKIRQIGPGLFVVNLLGKGFQD